MCLVYKRAKNLKWISPASSRQWMILDLFQQLLKHEEESWTSAIPSHHAAILLSSTYRACTHKSAQTTNTFKFRKRLPCSYIQFCWWPALTILTRIKQPVVHLWRFSNNWLYSQSKRCFVNALHFLMFVSMWDCVWIESKTRQHRCDRMLRYMVKAIYHEEGAFVYVMLRLVLLYKCPYANHTH